MKSDSVSNRLVVSSGVAQHGTNAFIYSNDILGDRNRLGVKALP